MTTSQADSPFRTSSPTPALRRLVAACALSMALAATGVLGSAEAQDPDYTLTLIGSAVEVGAEVAIPVHLDSTAGIQISGWSYGVCHDAATLQVEEVAMGPYIATFVNGGPPEFWQVQILPDGFALGAVIFAAGAVNLQPGEYIITETTYENLAPAGTTTAVELCDTLGSPPVSVIVVPNGAQIQPVRVDTTIGVHENVPFIRGDANDDGIVDIADVIALLGGLFLGTGFADCLGADDANGDGQVDIADPIKSWSSLFSSGAPPPAPYPDCAPSPTGDACRTRRLCP